MRAMGEDIGALVRSIGFRHLEGELSCVMGIGSAAWDRIVAPPANPGARPRSLHPVSRHRSRDRGRRPPLQGTSCSTFGRCASICASSWRGPSFRQLGSSVSNADEVHGFRYFEARDLLGFVDGTENPVGDAMAEAALIGDEDPGFRRRKLRHRAEIPARSRLHGTPSRSRSRSSSSVAPSSRTSSSTTTVKPANAHNALNVIEVDGEEISILRDNMPFGNAAHDEFGTYFIGYARDPGITEQMLQNMFVGRPAGNYDRILDFSTAITGFPFLRPLSSRPRKPGRHRTGRREHADARARQNPADPWGSDRYADRHVLEPSEPRPPESEDEWRPAPGGLHNDHGARAGSPPPDLRLSRMCS